MIWSPEFMQRVMFNSAKAYVRQLDRKEDFHLLEPVYSLNLVNDVFEKDVPEYYHYYRMVHEMHTEKVSVVVARKAMPKDSKKGLHKVMKRVV